ncbi:MAG: glutamate--tRNA ligase, partial [Flavobacteriaceae bacterium]
VRVRFAPSPTGPLHIGGVRTALFNYLFAKQNKGAFILRIEDTDQSRYVAGAEDYIETALNWLNIPYDEGPYKPGQYGPYRQSERRALYFQHAEQLIAKGSAYYAFDTPEDLSELRRSSEAKGETFTYNALNRGSLRNSLSMGEAQTKALLEQGAPHVIRFKTPTARRVVCQDLVRGELVVDSSVLDDKILFKSDGMPTYHLANVVDDHLMAISHVIRGEEWLPSLALHILLYEAFDWTAPAFAHLPLILKPTGKGKLSKRDGALGGFPVFPLEWTQGDEVFDGYREQGYFPEAVLNLLALLGWNSGDEQEVFSLEALTQRFDLSRVQKSGAKFDPQKALWFQNHYFQSQSSEFLVDEFSQWLTNQNIATPVSQIESVIPLIKERASFIKELWAAADFFFQRPTQYDEAGAKRTVKENTCSLVADLTPVLNEHPWDSEQTLSAAVKDWCADRGVGMGQVMMPMKGPDVFQIMMLLGKQEVLTRLRNGLEAFQK